jgi:DDE superfamily endonuclease
MEKYNITADNLYNFDEKGFVIGLGSASKRIMARQALESGRILGASQDGSREFISLIASICADGTYLPPTLIYKGQSHDIQDTWLEEFSESETAYFGCSDAGWSNDSLGLQWLERVFDRHTREKAGRGRRLLIVDGHSSHVNLKFLDYADRHRIIILILPPHSTHRLQPLDVGLFSPLARAYSYELEMFMQKCQGFVSMSKRMFWPMFRTAWETSFTEKNITSAWKATGIFPFDPQKLLSVIDPRPITPPEASNSAIGTKTPMSGRAMRRAYKSLKNDPTNAALERIIRGSEKLAAMNDCLQHEVRGLREAISLEKKKRKRGKRLNLLGEEDSGPQLFSPARIAKARLIASEKEEAERQKKEEAENRKAQASALRLKKEQEKEERAAAREAAKQLKQAEKVRLQAEKALQKELREQEKRQKELKKAERAATRSTEAPKTTPTRKHSRGLNGATGRKNKQAMNESENNNEDSISDIIDISNSHATGKVSQSSAANSGVSEDRIGRVVSNGPLVARSRTRAIRKPQRFNL